LKPRPARRDAAVMIKITAMLAALVLGLAACGSSDDKNASSSGTSASDTSSSDSSGGAYSKGAASTSSKTASESEGSNEVEMYDNYFDPKTITGKPGAKVTIELKNEGSAEHTFTIDSENVDEEIEGGEDGKVTVTIPKSGSLEFYCKYHKGLGMTGTLKAT
jgi:plastocyanin